MSNFTFIPSSLIFRILPSTLPYSPTSPVALQPPSTSSKPRILVLPGMDGSGLLLTPFRNTLSSPCDPDRVIPIIYPPDQQLSVPSLAAHVTRHYLDPLSADARGYILVNQSFSGHVGFYLARQAPKNLVAQVFVNAFISPPGPSFLHHGRTNFPLFFFYRQPPAWMVSDIFLGKGAKDMKIVQAAGAAVSPAVMRHRLDLCLREDSWHIWRRKDLLPSTSTLYLRGDADVIVTDQQAQQIHSARPDIAWVSIPDGPHLLLQRFGVRCARVVDTFCDHVMEQARCP